jgi:hypothetical protein
VGKRISKIPAHTQDDHFSGVLPSFERIAGCDRHGFYRIKLRSSKFAMEHSRYSAPNRGSRGLGMHLPTPNVICPNIQTASSLTGRSTFRLQA